MLRRRALTLVVALGFLLSQATRARAADSAAPGASELQTARELFAEAEKEESQGAFASALEKMRRVGQIKMTPGIRVHIAFCEEHVGHLVAALGEYALADAQAESESNHEVQRMMREPLEALQARVPRVVIRVPPDVKGLEVALDGKVLVPGVLGMAMPVDPRPHQIEANAPGFLPFRASFVGKERDRAEVVVRLETLSTPREVHQERVRNRTPAIVVTAGALALAGAGVGAFLVAGSKQAEARDACARAFSCADGRPAAIRAVRTWDTLGLISWIGAGAAATMAVVLWTSRGSEKSTGRAPSGRIEIGAGSAHFEGSF